MSCSVLYRPVMENKTGGLPEGDAQRAYSGCDGTNLHSEPCSPCCVAPDSGPTVGQWEHRTVLSTGQGDTSHCQVCTCAPIERSSRSYLHGKARQGHSHRDTSSTWRYFPQPPPPPRKWAQWALGLAAWSIACFAAGTYVWTRGRVSPEMIVLEMLSHYKVTTDTVDRARVTPAVGMALADEILGERSGATDAPNAVTHTCQLPANLPCEDVFYAAVFRDRRHMHKGWGTWAIFDGHAGPWTAEVLSGLLPLFLAPRLDAAEYFKRRYIPNDPITSVSPCLLIIRVSIRMRSLVCNVNTLVNTGL